MSSSSGSELDVLTSKSESASSIEKAKVIEWEEFEQELARLWSLSMALSSAKEQKLTLSEKLESLLQVRSESVCQLNELEEMRQKLESRRLVLQNRLMLSRATAEETSNLGEQLSLKTRSLLVAGKALSVAFNQLQEANTLLGGKTGHFHLTNLQKMLRMRQQYMITQVSELYPIKSLLGQGSCENFHSCSDDEKSGEEIGSSIGNTKVNKLGPSSLIILGLQITLPPLKKISFFSDKKEVQRSATALGYVAHAVLLIASYLDVPLRYHLRLGGSRSYVFNIAPSFESKLTDSLASSLIVTKEKAAEFPLFLEGQETTKSAYAIFLLNKDIEQLMNYVGIQSLGPRHVLANLKELLRTIQSHDYVDS